MGAVLAALYAAFVVTHVWLAIVVARRRKWWDGILVLLLAPLAPWWAWQSGARIATWTWIGTVLVYAVAVAVAGR
jgi:hypothetical protein